MCNKLHLLGCSLALAAAASLHGQVTGSLWDAGDVPARPMTADRTALQVGDLVTIRVSLSTTATKDQKTNTAEKSDTTAELAKLIFTGKGGGNWGWYQNGGENPGLSFSSDRSYQGGGKIDNKETLTTTAQARVVDVAPNGVLQIEARRFFETGKERSELVVTGFVRREDLSTDNSVSSDQIADLQIYQQGAGPLSRDQKKGWLTRLYEYVKPF